MASAIVGKMLKEIGFKIPSIGLTYLRAPGAKFWTGYRGQPCVVFDDFMNMRGEEAKAALSELFLLKSPQVF